MSCGNASGPPPAIGPRELARRGSLFLTRPLPFNYIVTCEGLTSAARAVRRREVKVSVVIPQKYPLAEAAAAQRDLEGRRTTDATVLLP